MTARIFHGPLDPVVDQRTFVIDGLSPEDSAMLQALYSRSAQGVSEHLAKLGRTGSGKFMESYYVGYNHKSIADCGSTTMFVENVSMLAAKAIEDWPLYSGQETSTRFIDMGHQPLVDPIGTARSREVQSRWMAFYNRAQEPTAREVRRRHPMREGEKKEKYEGAVKARVFDILRGFLPAGICTQLSWHTNLRQAADHLNMLRFHPLFEVRAIAQSLTGLLFEAYPSSFASAGVGKQADVSGVVGGEAEREAWRREVANEWTYSTEGEHAATLMEALKGERFTIRTALAQFQHRIDRYRLVHNYGEILSSRPRGAILPHFMNDLGQIHFGFLLDFGSFRDIQRHRNGVCRMPILSTEFGFEPWYIEQLDVDLALDAERLIKEQSETINHILTNEAVLQQYYIPMGYRVPCQVSYTLPAAVYVAEIRSAKTVHPTLRRIAHWMHSAITLNLPEVKMHTDLDVDDWTLRRAEQDIVERGARR